MYHKKPCTGLRSFPQLFDHIFNNRFLNFIQLMIIARIYKGIYLFT